MNSEEIDLQLRALNDRGARQLVGWIRSMAKHDEAVAKEMEHFLTGMQPTYFDTDFKEVLVASNHSHTSNLRTSQEAA